MVPQEFIITIFENCEHLFSDNNNSYSYALFPQDATNYVHDFFCGFIPNDD